MRVFFELFYVFIQFTYMKQSKAFWISALNT